MTEIDAKDDKAVWNEWYPLGSPIDLRRTNRTKTWLLDREIDLTIHKTWIAAACGSRPLPVTERLGYVWTTLGEPQRGPQSVTEYYEVDRMAMNIWSTPIKCSGLRIVDNVIDNAHFPFVHPNILGDENHLELAEYTNTVDENGELWSRSHRAWLPLIDGVAEYTYRIASPYTVLLLIHRLDDNGRKRFDYLGVFAQPVTQDSFIAHKMLAFVREPWMNERQVRVDQQCISVQDKYVLERHSIKRLPLDGELESSVGVDSASLAYRAWLRDKDVRYGALR